MTVKGDNKKAVVLLSGGLDSATVLAIAQQQAYQTYCLSIDYGQRHSVELQAAKAIARYAKATRHMTVQVNIGALGGSALVDSNLPIADFTPTDDIPATYVPARNTIFLAMAMGYAEVLGSEVIFAGMNAIDYSGYPDCRPVYIDAFNQLAKVATKASVTGHPIRVEAPLLHLTKAQIIQLGVSLGVDYSHTVSCYRAGKNGMACGRCDSCVLRQKGFHEAGVSDPTHYSDNS